ncbi:division abnormally delayed protein [Ostrinia nubilalis]|uniref:division abnormally delayed protein n=1 Tax=Ostrinia nubilalis TaxID=29057 RepID=UPI003082646A
MKCLVLVLVVACVGADAAATCSFSQDFFLRHNVSADESSEPGPLCGGQCCGRGQEIHLRNSLRRVAERRLAATTKPIKELLLSTRRTLQEHLIELSRQSQNKTAGFFQQLYRRHATRAHTPLGVLYDDIRALLASGPDRDSENLGSRPPKDLAESSRKFFREVFPVAYQSVLKLESKRFTPEYDECLKAAYDAVLPFGDIPEQMGSSLSRSLEAARVLLQVLAAGAGALESSELVLSQTNEECFNKLLRVAGCARCKGHYARPCKNFCLNVARGCIGSPVAELDAPWAGYVEGLERLSRPDADVALREMETQLSKAIMYALENQSILESKVRQECGTPSTFELPASSSPHLPPARREALRAPPPYTELLQFAASLARNKKLFARLADRLCDEPDFQFEGNDQCWNGETIGEYTKPLVASASLSDQKYNPEMSGTPEDSKVAALGERLRQARQLLVTHSKTAGIPAAEAFMQGDEAGLEGSGSGRYGDNDDTYDDEGSGEEGSGIEGDGVRTMVGEENTHSSTPKTSSAKATQPLIPIVIGAALLSVRQRLT